jgi:hypothetical protein
MGITIATQMAPSKVKHGDLLQLFLYAVARDEELRLADH